MRKLHIIPVLLLFISNISVHGQSDSIERHLYFAKLKSKEVSQEEFAKRWRDWKLKIAEIKGYPDLPLDQIGQVHYTFVNKFENIGKTVLFSRALEWLAINYGIIPSNIYSSKEDGKIIYRNAGKLIGIFSCNYTSVISISDGKIYTEFISIGYEYPLSADEGSPTFSFSINEAFPVILKKPSDWDSKLSLLRSTNEFFKREIENLELYVSSYNSTYDNILKPSEK